MCQTREARVKESGAVKHIVVDIKEIDIIEM